VPFSVGDLIDDHYRVEQRYAGGMGFVYIVLDEVVRKRFAIKQLSELHAEKEVLRERFRREAATWLQLDYHPHIVQAHSYMQRMDAPMLILEYVDGPSLDLMLRAEKRLCPAQVVAYARQFCRAMQHAHSRVIPDRGVGVLHRDIKPGNLLLTRTNQLKVTDFGLAKILGDVNLTSEGQFVGTVAYSPPEQLRGAGDVSKASDVYSFGAVMYQMLAGQQPFRGSNPADLYCAVQETEPRSIRDVNPEVEFALAQLVARCLKKRASERYTDFHELEKAINEIQLSDNPRARACHNCGFISYRSLTRCSVCSGAQRAVGKKEPSKTRVPARVWNCSCGANVPGNREKCPDCGRLRSTLAKAASEPGSLWPQSSDFDAPLPVFELADSPQQRRAEQMASWNLDAGKEYLVELKSNGAVMPWLLERSGYTLGRADSMKIRIDDSRIAQFQLFLVRLPCGWLAMNPQLNPCVEVNGWSMRQRVLRPGDLLHMGATWLAYAGPSGISEPLAPIPGRWSEKGVPSGQTVRAGGSHLTMLDTPCPSACTLELAGDRRFSTRGHPLRVGSSPLCEVRLDDPSVAPIHALVAWQVDGPHLINIAGSLVRKVAGDAITDHLLRDGDLLEIGSTPVRARVEGDQLLPGLRWAEATASPGRLAMTVLTGPQRGQTAVLPVGQTLTLGRHSDCDVIIASDSFISRRHVELTASALEIDFKDLGSRGGFFLNQTHFTTSAVAHLGDVSVFGKTSLLVHHEVDAE
jgi:serine/threonine protein kinase/pSer/pThr/pTyr-binding forkhead associated (FHA) protein